MPRARFIAQLEQLARGLLAHGVDAVLIGSAALELRGLPVKSHDFDFLFRDSPAQRRHLAAMAHELDGVLTRPFFRRSLRWRLQRDADNLVADFVCALDGFRDPTALWARAERMAVGDTSLWVAQTADLLRSKRASGRAKDLATVAQLERAAELKKGQAAR